MSERKSIRFGPFELDLECGELRKDGTRLKLQGQPIQILELLLSKNGELVSREEIRQRLWSGDTFVDFEHSLNTAIKKLRQTLGDEAVEPRYIETLPKRGYRFVGEVETPAAEFAPHEFVAGVMQGMEFEQANVSTRRKTSFRLHLGPSIAAFLLLLVAATVATRYFRAIPMPRIVATHVLTHTGYPKSNLVTDGRMLYFLEQRPAGQTIMTMPMTGGEPREVAIVPDIAGFSVSNDGLQLLMNLFNREEKRLDAWIQPLPGGPRRLLIKDALNPKWSGDGQHIIFGRNGSYGDYRDLYEAKADGTAIRLLAHIPTSNEFAIAPDGKRIYIRPSTTTATWEVEMDGSVPRPIRSIEAGAHLGAWTSDEKYYFYTGPGPGEPNPSELRVIAEERDWRGKPEMRSTKLTSLPISLGAPAVSGEGKRIFVNTVLRRGELTVLDKKSGEFVPYALPISACYTDFSPDGQWIAYVSYPEAILSRSRVDGSERMQLTSPPIRPFLPRWSPDGKLVLFSEMPVAGTGLIKSNIYAVSTEGGEPLLISSGTPFAVDATWSSDGSAIAYSDGTELWEGRSIRILDLKSGQSVELAGSKGLYSPRWSPDGKYILALSFPATRLMLYSLSTQQWREIASSSGFGFPSWTRDSRYIQIYRADDRVIRINVSTLKTETVADMTAVSAVDVNFALWLGITPDGLPITTRDTGTHEIYAFDLEYK